MPSKLSVVIPCYNERATVATLVERVLNVTLPPEWGREVIVVDDASTDGTRDVLATLPSSVRVHLRDRNDGKGSAVVDGFNLATGTHLLMQDADLEYDPKDIPKLLDAIAPGTAVYGSRELASRIGAPILRTGVRFLTGLVNLLYDKRLTDICTCYKLIPREAAHLFKPGGFTSDILLAPALFRNGYRIVEVPISYAPRTKEGGKKIKYRDGIHAIWALLADYARHGRSGIMNRKP